VNRLVEAGHETFGLISGPEDSSVSVERTQGALERLKELDVKSVTVVPGDYSYESGASGLLELKNKLGELPDAVVCANERRAQILMFSMTCITHIGSRRQIVDVN
jgi:DNA-binding LacI/PurR family transcriptional regulator